MKAIRVPEVIDYVCIVSFWKCPKDSTNGASDDSKNRNLSLKRQLSAFRNQATTMDVMQSSRKKVVFGSALYPLGYCQSHSIRLESGLYGGK